MFIFKTFPYFYSFDDDDLLWSWTEFFLPCLVRVWGLNVELFCRLEFLLCFVLCNVLTFLMSILMPLTGLKDIVHYLPTKIIQDDSSFAKCVWLMIKMPICRDSWLITNYILYTVIYLTNLHAHMRGSSLFQAPSSCMLCSCPLNSMEVPENAAEATHLWRYSSICSVSSLLLLLMSVMQLFIFFLWLRIKWRGCSDTGNLLDI